jgi:hypothetical protein
VQWFECLGGLTGPAGVQHIDDAIIQQVTLGQNANGIQFAIMEWTPAAMSIFVIIRV